jgi:predicted enzyme related to lactoylglutathione lyase
MTNTQTQPPTDAAGTDATTLSPAPVSWFEVHTADPARAKLFYAAVFGWRYDESMPEYTMVELGEGAPIGGGIVDSGGEYPSQALFMVQVPDVAAALAAAAANGGSIIAEAQSTPVGITYGYAANPDGSVFGIWCPPAE